MSNKRRRTCDSWTETRPDLLAQWDFIKNDDFPTDIRVSSQMAWWLCNVETCGHGCPHSWQAPLGNRMMGSGCPYCARKKFCTHYSLEVKEPELAQEFDTERNGGLQAKDVYYRSNQKVWWKCKIVNCDAQCEHVYQAIVANRTYLASGCPHCSALLTCKHNSLATKRPDVMAWWHYEKNQGLNPEKISCKSSLTAWWKCQNTCTFGCTHEWKTSISHISDGSGCPYCSGFRVCVHNSLAYHYPELAKEWSADNDRIPSEIPLSSSYKAKWKCRSCQREWRATVNSRTDRTTGCWVCMRGVSKMELAIGKTLDAMQRWNKFAQWKLTSVDANVSHLLPGYELDKVVRIELPNGSIESVAIEMDGRQHFVAVEYWGGEVGFKTRQATDQHKNKVCCIIRMHLLRIGYDVKATQYFQLVSAFFDRVAATPSAWQFQCVGKHYQQD